MVTSRFEDPTFLALAAKKAGRFVLKHNWFADPLEVARFQQTFDQSLQQLASSIGSNTFAVSSLKRLVVPKRIKEKTVRHTTKKVHEVRELAHLDFQSQVFSVAIVMAIADHWETLLGKLKLPEKKLVLGNRLDMHQDTEGHPSFPLGTYALFRFWGEDYSGFVRSTAEQYNTALLSLKQPDRRLCLLSTDISSFYPNVSLDRLSHIVRETPGLNQREQEQIARFFSEINRGMKEAKLSGLPQGMVASGFFANIFLHEFDEKVVQSIGESVSLKKRNPKFVFYSRYVDDIRLIVETSAAVGHPARKAEKHALYKALSRVIDEYGLSFSPEKSTLLEQSMDGTSLGEGLLAERMESLANKAYGSLAPESIDDFATQFELLFSTDSVAERRPAGGEVQRDRYNPVLDGPGVRPDSRKRFAAGRWRHLFFTYKDCSDELLNRKSRFVQELLRDWKSDPSQLRLLHYVFELDDFSHKNLEEVLQFLKRYEADKFNLKAKEWIPFIKASIIRAYMSRSLVNQMPDNDILKMVRECIADSTTPWFLRLLAWTYLGANDVRNPVRKLREFAAKEQDESCRRAIRFWQFLVENDNEDGFRVRFNTAKSLGIGLKLKEKKIRSYLSRSRIDIREAEQVVTENLDVLTKCSNIEIYDNELFQFARRLGLNISLLNSQAQPRLALGPKEGDSLRLPSLLSEHLIDGRYRTEQGAIELGIKIIEVFNSMPIATLNTRAITGEINPFAIEVGSNMSLVDGYGLAGWRSIDWSKVSWVKPELISPPWAWPLGLLLRAALTGRKEHLYGAPASSRYSLFMNFRRLNAEGAFCSEEFAEFLMSLLRWPGADIKPIADLATAKDTLTEMLTRAKGQSVEGIQLLPIEVQCGSERRDIVSIICQVDNGLKLDQVRNDIPQARRAVLYTLSEVERRILLAKGLGIQISKDSDPFPIVILPELFVPDEAIGDIHRFVKKNRAAVLFGRYFWDDHTRRRRNSLYWVFPAAANKIGPSTYSIRQDKFFPTTQEVESGVIGADPKVIWRIGLGKHRRICALNCYEVTNAQVKSLLSGRVEGVFVSAYNKDVETFDTTVLNFSYEIFGFVGLANNGTKGGSCVYAPYSGGSHAKRLLHKHGEDQFLISIKSISLSHFRDSPPPSDIKQAPAGFIVKD